MVSATTQVSLLRRHGSHSLSLLFSISLAEAADGFRATFQWLNIMQLSVWEYLAVWTHSVYCISTLLEPNQMKVGFVITTDKISYVAKEDSICLFSVAKEMALNEQRIKPCVPLLISVLPPPLIHLNKFINFWIKKKFRHLPFILFYQN